MLVWLDLFVMPASAPVVRLGPSWLTGEMVVVAICLIPAQLLGRWTLTGSNLRARALMQAAAFSALSLWVFPTIALVTTGGTWSSLLHRPAWVLEVGAQLLAIPAAMAAAAVLEFGQRGGGTPFPWDPPVRLVTSGPYAYVANPMQLSMTVILFGLGAMLGSWGVMLAAPISGLFGAGFAAWQEHGDLDARYGERWMVYRRDHRNWLPRLRPVYPPEQGQSTLYFAASCVECSSVGMWFQRRQPIGLDLVPAEEFPEPELPMRITYVGADGAKYSGIAALARATDHLHLGWAITGWVARLPVVSQLLQVMVDAVGGGERTIERGARLGVSVRPR
jgi:protein-S-isoprenylcysteine O-methyltransferase Ste14